MLPSSAPVFVSELFVNCLYYLFLSHVHQYTETCSLSQIYATRGKRSRSVSDCTHSQSHTKTHARTPAKTPDWVRDRESVHGSPACTPVHVCASTCVCVCVCVCWYRKQLCNSVSMKLRFEGNICQTHANTDQTQTCISRVCTPHSCHKPACHSALVRAATRAVPVIVACAERPTTALAVCYICEERKKLW